MKKMNLAISVLTLGILGASVAFANPMGMGPGQGHGMKKPHEGHQMMNRGSAMKKALEKAPEEIRAAYKELRILRKDLALELAKSEPDAAKAMEMVKKSEELHAKVQEWKVSQILKGELPKPQMRRAPGNFRGGMRRNGPCGPWGPRHGFGPGFGMHGAPVPPRFVGCPCMKAPVPPAPVAPQAPEAK